MHGDKTTATALELAKAHLEKQGWKYTPQDIGHNAKLILLGLSGGSNNFARKE